MTLCTTCLDIITRVGCGLWNGDCQQQQDKPQDFLESYALGNPIPDGARAKVPLLQVLHQNNVFLCKSLAVSQYCIFPRSITYYCRMPFHEDVAMHYAATCLQNSVAGCLFLRSLLIESQQGKAASRQQSKCFKRNEWWQRHSWPSSSCLCQPFPIISRPVHGCLFWEARQQRVCLVGKGYSLPLKFMLETRYDNDILVISFGCMYNNLGGSKLIWTQ
jgi:hypothetical protein